MLATKEAIMFEIRNDIPLPTASLYPWETMKVGECLVFTDTQEFKAAEKSARKQTGKRFLCQNNKIWLVERNEKSTIETRVLNRLRRNDSMTQGVIVNQLRVFPQKEVIKTLNELVDSGTVIAKKSIHKYNGRNTVSYRMA
jgi:hypothetical protein